MAATCLRTEDAKADACCPDVYEPVGLHIKIGSLTSSSPSSFTATNYHTTTTSSSSSLRSSRSRWPPLRSTTTLETQSTSALPIGASTNPRITSLFGGDVASCAAETS